MRMSSVTIGHRYERAYADTLRSQGYRVQRSAASKGLFDLVAYRFSDVIFVQCKAGPMTCRTARAFAGTLVGEVPFYAAARVTHRTATVEYCTHDG